MPTDRRLEVSIVLEPGRDRLVITSTDGRLTDKDIRRAEALKRILETLRAKDGDDA